MINSMFHKGFLVTLLLAALGGAISAQANLPLSDVPLFVATSVDPNVLINLSVETPVGGPAYNDMNDAGCLHDVIGKDSMVCYTASKNYLGYFDPNKCYLYDDTNEYFYPTGPSGFDHACAGGFSGNMLNWSTMNAIDTFVWTMTGGNRVVDTQTETIVEVFGASKFWKDKHKAITATYNVAPDKVYPFPATELVLTVDQEGDGGDSTVKMTTKAGWTMTSDSHEHVGEDGAASNVIDGDASTIWHTQWSASNPVHPHWIQFDLGGDEELTGLTYLPRQTGPINGTIADYRVLVSSDGVSFTEVASGTWANNRDLKTVTFPEQEVDYLRLEALSEVNGKAWSSAAEIGLLDEDGDVIPPPSPSNTTRHRIQTANQGLRQLCRSGIQLRDLQLRGRYDLQARRPDSGECRQPALRSFQLSEARMTKRNTAG